MIRLEIKNVKELRDAIKSYPQVSTQEVNTAINKSLIHVQREAIEEAPVGVTGKLRSSWKLKVQNLEGYLRNKMKYAIYVHEGTKPHWVSRKHLQKWADVKGIPVFLVQKAIATKGTKANPFLKRAVEKSQSAVDNYFDEALDNIMKKI